MGLIKFASRTQMPEGTYVFKLASVVYEKDYGKVKITFRTEDGQSHYEEFRLLNNNGTPSDIGQYVFGLLVKAALNDFDCEGIEEDEVSEILTGRYVRGTIVHRTYEKKTGGVGTAANIRDFEPVEDAEVEEEAPADNSDIDDLLKSLV